MTVGITQPSFRCTRCGQYRRTKGRKRLGKGYVCALCLEPQHPLKGCLTWPTNTPP